jgi:hypothetical protein
MPATRGRLAQPAAREALDEDIGRDVNVDRDAHLAAPLCDAPLECLCLWNGARETVQESPVRRIRLVEAIGDHVQDEAVRHQVATIHVLLG